MQRTALAQLFMISMILFSGCNALGIVDDQSTEPTLTPAAVPTDEPTPTPVPQLAPGLTGNGIEDTSTLVRAHNNTLQNNSFTLSTVSAARYPNGTLFSRRATLTRVGEEGHIFSTVNLTTHRPPEAPANYSPPIWYEGWVGENGSMIMTKYANNTTSYTKRPTNTSELKTVPPYATNVDTISRLLSGTKTDVTDKRTRNGTRLYHIDATALRSPFLDPPSLFLTEDSGTFENASQQALISSRGVVRDHQLIYTTTNGSATFDILYRSQYTSIGSTEIERPSWYEKAVNETSTQTPA